MPTTILTRASQGPPTQADQPASPFELVDQNGRSVSLAGLRGKVVVLTFLDPVCTSDCPTIAREFVATGKLLGGTDRNVDLVAIDANPRYLGTQFLQAFDSEQNLGSVPNWHYLSGSLAQLQQVWRSYGVEISYETGGAMIDHSEIAFVIDATGTPGGSSTPTPAPRPERPTRPSRSPGLRRAKRLAFDVRTPPVRSAAGRSTRVALMAAATTSAALLAGCGSSASAGGSAALDGAGASRFPWPRPTSLPVALGGGGHGRPVTTAEYLLELFHQAASGGAWSDDVEVTATATNGGLVVAGEGNDVVVGVVPSQNLTFTPLVLSHDSGRTFPVNGLVPGGWIPRPTRWPRAPAGGFWPSSTVRRGRARLPRRGPRSSKVTPLSTVGRSWPVKSHSPGPRSPPRAG